MRTVRRHTSSAITSSCVDYSLPWWRPTPEEEDEVRCAYCGCMTDDHYEPGCWDLPLEEFLATHERRARDSANIGITPPLDDPQVRLNGSITERKACLHICPQCGWWIAEDRVVLRATRSQLWVVTLASISALQELALNDIDIPLLEVRRYLMRRFVSRASMHPRLFELTVASVFADHGYRATATAYSNDGGIDIVLEDSSGKRIGVQVKRQKNSIEVEQLRAFLGALILEGYAKGVFVTSSRFRSGAINCAKRSSEKSMPIELVDADRFFDMLRYAQLQRTPSPEDCVCMATALKFHDCDWYYLNSP